MHGWYYLKAGSVQGWFDPGLVHPGLVHPGLVHWAATI